MPGKHRLNQMSRTKRITLVIEIVAVVAMWFWFYFHTSSQN